MMVWLSICRYFAATTAIATLVAPANSWGATHQNVCPMIGASYTAHVAGSPGDLTYRLQIDALPKSAPDAAFATLWRFQVVDKHTGTKLSELRMHYSCANGLGPCSVSPPGRPGIDGGYYSEVVQLNKDFTLATSDQAPYALVLPGFGRDNWTFSSSDMTMSDLTLFTAAKVTPDMHNHQTWLLSACGPEHAPG